MRPMRRLPSRRWLPCCRVTYRPTRRSSITSAWSRPRPPAWPNPFAPRDQGGPAARQSAAGATFARTTSSHQSRPDSSHLPDAGRLDRVGGGPQGRGPRRGGPIQPAAGQRRGPRRYRNPGAGSRQAEGSEGRSGRGRVHPVRGVPGQDPSADGAGRRGDRQTVPSAGERRADDDNSGRAGQQQICQIRSAPQTLGPGAGLQHAQGLPSIARGTGAGRGRGHQINRGYSGWYPGGQALCRDPEAGVAPSRTLGCGHRGELAHG